MPIIRIAKFEDLVAFMTETNMPYEADGTKKIAVMPLNKPPLVGQMLIRWETELPYVQVTYELVRNVPPDRRIEVERAICVANHNNPVAGFGFDPGNNVVYFRLTVPMYDEGMLAKSFRHQLDAVIRNSRHFLIPFQQVVAGEPGDAILRLAAAAAQARAV